MILTRFVQQDISSQMSVDTIRKIMKLTLKNKLQYCRMSSIIHDKAVKADFTKRNI